MIITLLTTVTLIALLGGVYLLPVLIGVARRVPDIGAVAVINILLGWTLIGWTVALAMALRSARPADPVVHVVQNPPQWAQSSPPPGTGWADPTGPPSFRYEPPPLVLPPRPARPDDWSASEPTAPEEPVPPARWENSSHDW